MPMAPCTSTSPRCSKSWAWPTRRRIAIGWLRKSTSTWLRFRRAQPSRTNEGTLDQSISQPGANPQAGAQADQPQIGATPARGSHLREAQGVLPGRAHTLLLLRSICAQGMPDIASPSWSRRAALPRRTILADGKRHPSRLDPQPPRGSHPARAPGRTGGMGSVSTARRKITSMPGEEELERMRKMQEELPQQLKSDYVGQARHTTPTQQFRDECNQLRALIDGIGKEVLKFRTNPPRWEQADNGEVIANIMLSYRHLEDARMRLGKAIQATEGGVSIYDRKS